MKEGERLRDILSRLRASLSPQVLAVFVALALFLAFAGHGNGVTNLEKSVSKTLSSVDGTGKVSVTIRMREMENGTVLGEGSKRQSIPAGAVAVAQGADDPLVAMQIHDALCALLGLAPGAVSVIAGGR